MENNLQSPWLTEITALARSGDRPQALLQLRALLGDQPDNETAWLLLADLTPDRSEKVAALTRAIALNPQNGRARARLNQLRGEEPPTPPSDTETQQTLRQARRLWKRGQTAEATGLLRQLVEIHWQEETAWLWLSELEPDIADCAAALEHALSLNPTNRRARRRLETLQKALGDPIRLGRLYEQRGDLARAEAAYIEALWHITDPARRAQVTSSLETVRIRKERPGYRRISAQFSVARLSLGPPLLYITLVLLHSGLRLNTISLPLAIGVAAVLLGSYLVALTQTEGVDNRWSASAWDGGGADPLQRAGPALLGLLLYLAPFGWLFYEAFNRG